MASNSTGGLLPGQSAPLTVITATDQSGIVLIATALGLSFAIISFIIRIYIRLEFRHQFSRDDVVCAFAMVSPYWRVSGRSIDTRQVFAVIQSSTVFVAVSKGFGKTLADVDLVDLVPLQKAS